MERNIQTLQTEVKNKYRSEKTHKDENSNKDKGNYINEEIHTHIKDQTDEKKKQRWFLSFFLLSCLLCKKEKKNQI